MELFETNYVPLVRLYAVKEKFLPYGMEEVNHPKKVVDLVSRLLAGADREYVLAIPVDTVSKPVAVEIVGIGTLNQAVVQPREVFKHAILCNAAGVILLHNHPSGKVEPSEADYQITQRMKKAGELLGIELLDHIIVGDDGRYTSMHEMEQGECTGETA